MKQESQTRLVRRRHRTGRSRPPRWCRSTWGRRLCSWCRTGSARRPGPRSGSRRWRRELLELEGVEAAAHPPGGILRDVVGPAQLVVRGRAGADLVHHLRAALAGDLDDEPVPATVDQLGERQVVGAPRPCSGWGPVPMETQKQVPPGSEQVDRDDEGLGAPVRVAAVLVDPAHEDGVVDAEGAQVARPDADQCVRRVLGRLLGRFDSELVPSPLAAPEHFLGGEEHRLGGLGAGREAEQLLVVPPPQPVVPRVLVVAPPTGRSPTPETGALTIAPDFTVDR